MHETVELGNQHVKVHIVRSNPRPLLVSQNYMLLVMRNSKLSVESCQLRVVSRFLSVVSWFLSVAILQATNILFIGDLIVIYLFDTNA